MPSDGGDYPEYALYAMLQGLQVTVKEGSDIFPLMVEGSQMVVLTDASSKQTKLIKDVIDAAVHARICIHFFINHPEYALTDGIYEEIANKTHGTLLRGFTHWDIVKFTARYSNRRCEYLENFRVREKRSLTFAIPSNISSDIPPDTISNISMDQSSINRSSQCNHFVVSRLVFNLRLSIQADTGNNITIFRPNGTDSTFTVGKNNLAFFNETKPESGRWSVCSNSSTIEVNDIVTYSIITTVLYRNGSIIVPPACKT